MNQSELMKKFYYDIRLIIWKIVWKFPKIAIFLKISPSIYYPKKYMPRVFN